MIISEEVFFKVIKESISFSKSQLFQGYSEGYRTGYTEALQDLRDSFATYLGASFMEEWNKINEQ